MLVVTDPDGAVGVPGQDGVVDLISRVGRIRIGRPFEVAERRSRVAIGEGWSVFAAVVGPDLEPLADVVRLEDGHAPGSQMLGRGRHRRPQVRLGGHVADRIVD